MTARENLRFGATQIKVMASAGAAHRSPMQFA